MEEGKGQPQWAFFHITQDAGFYYGNAGLHTAYLGNILEMSRAEIYAAIVARPANYDYTSFYDLGSLPPIRDVLKSIRPLKTNHVFPDVPSCLYHWLDAVGTKTILI